MGSGGGDGWDPEEDIRKMLDNPVDTLVSGLVNYATYGTVGYENGKISRGVTIRALDETVGEVTGRNVARKQAMNTQDAINEQRAQAAKDRQTQIQQQEARERQLSGRAKQNNNTAQGSTGSLGGIEQQMAADFLGL